jgi:thiamine-monophosphate kinase
MNSQKKQFSDSDIPSEFEIIKQFFRPLAIGNKASLGLKDDVALLQLYQPSQIILTADAVVAGVHFFPQDPPGLIARKALRVNISDLAAKGAQPLGYLMTIAIPAGTSQFWLENFAAGLKIDQYEFGISLLGGDTVSTPGPLTISITAIGLLPNQARLPQRCHAQIGDIIGVSGTIGDAALGLQVLKGRIKIDSQQNNNFLKDRYWIPRPRLNLGIELVKHGMIHAMMDISDGLLGDLKHICNASSVGAEVDSTAIPLSSAALAAYQIDPDILPIILTGGDDYELLFTTSPDSWPIIERFGQKLGVPISKIGHIISGSELIVLDKDSKIYPIEPKGYQHF